MSDFGLMLVCASAAVALVLGLIWATSRGFRSEPVTWECIMLASALGASLLFPAAITLLFWE